VARTSAQRQSDKRRREAEGLIHVGMVLPEDDLVAALIEARLLCPADADDRKKVATAAGRFMRTAIDVTRDAG
jgi:hypothetical protein